MTSFYILFSELGKLNTWGSTDDLGQSYVTSGKHEENPEPFPLQTDAAIIQAAAGWAHCVAVTDRGEVYTWGWKECVPTSKVTADQVATVTSSSEKESSDSQAELLKDQGARNKTAASGLLQNDKMGGNSSAGTKPHFSRSVPRISSSSGLISYDQSGEDGAKRRRLVAAKQASLPETSAGDETVSAPPCLVTLRPGVKVVTVAAGGRHTLVLSDTGQVWGWGYGGEGQLGLGSRIRTVSSPQPVPCIDTSSHWKELHPTGSKGNRIAEGQATKVPGNCVKAIACGGRHSAVITGEFSVFYLLV
eukprot:PITA_20760